MNRCWSFLGAAPLKTSTESCFFLVLFGREEHQKLQSIPRLRSFQRFGPLEYLQALGGNSLFSRIFTASRPVGRGHARAPLTAALRPRTSRLWFRSIQKH
eukprot:s2149_g1.t1